MNRSPWTLLDFAALAWLMVAVVYTLHVIGSI